MINQRLSSTILLRGNNPVLDYELNRIPFALKKQKLWLYLRLMILIISVPAVALWYLAVMHVCNQPYYNYYTNCVGYYGASGKAGLILVMILVGGTLLGLIVDLYYVSLPMNRFLREKEAGHWDLLRLTLLPEPQIIAAKYISTQSRAWRATAIEVGLRLAGAVSLLILFIGSASYTSSSNSVFWQLLPSLLVVATVYILEPVWRMRMVVAMGLVIAMLSNNLTFSMLAGFGALFAMRILQGFIIFVFLNFLFNITAHTNSQFAGLFMWYIATASAAGIIYFFYRQGRQWLLRRAIRLAYPA